jgi:PIN domain nuclease of toxin-antitoxin system
VRILLDTHVAFWWFNDVDRVGHDARVAIQDSSNDVWMSAASVWEVGIKRAVGRLEIPTPLDEAARETGVMELAVTWAHARTAAELPLLHGDPFDRMLVAQAQLEELVLLTRDPLVRQYDVATMPA